LELLKRERAGWGEVGWGEARDTCVGARDRGGKARVMMLESKSQRDEDDNEELKQNRPFLTVLFANLSDLRKTENLLRKEKACLEKREQQPREAAGNF
jgi:hypothetical protein